MKKGEKIWFQLLKDYTAFWREWIVIEART